MGFHDSMKDFLNPIKEDLNYQEIKNDTVSYGPYDINFLLGSLMCST